jgi:hypothetical protein
MAMPVLKAWNVRRRRIIAASVLAAALAAGFIGSIAMLAVEIQRVIDAAPMTMPRASVRITRSGISDARGSSAPQLTLPKPKGANGDVDDGHRHDA